MTSLLLYSHFIYLLHTSVLVLLYIYILVSKILTDWQVFVDWCIGEQLGEMGWLHLRHESNVTRGYQQCLQGQVPPDTALILSLWGGNAGISNAKL